MCRADGTHHRRMVAAGTAGRADWPPSPSAACCLPGQRGREIPEARRMFSDPFTAPAAGPAPLESTRNTLIDTNCPLRASDGRALRPVATQEWSTRFGAVFAAIGVILAGLSISLFVISPAPRLPMLLAMDLLSAVALGAQATAARLGGQGHHDGGGHVAAHRIGYGRIGDRCQAGLAAPGVGARVDQRRCAGRRGGTVRASRLGLGLSAVIMMARPTTAKPTGPSRHGRGAPAAGPGSPCPPVSTRYRSGRRAAPRRSCAKHPGPDRYPRRSPWW